MHFVDLFGLGATIRDMGRFALRYPGHRSFWRTMVELGFLDETPLQGAAGLSPRDFLVRQLGPRLQFGNGQRDVVLLRVRAWGLKDGRRQTLTHDLVDYRDMDTGLYAMNRTVGFTASIAAQMICSGVIDRPGVLSPARDVPAAKVIEELKRRGMRIDLRAESD